MRKPKPKPGPVPAPPPVGVRVQALKQFRHDGSYVTPGVLLVMSEIDAADLVAMGFARVLDRPQPERR
jgi:hypothetical protein